MYLMKSWNNQLNTVITLESNPCINCGIHWLNPLLCKCAINRLPDKISQGVF